MTTLERFAILGDHASQDECTRLGIMLQCPFCGGDAWEDHFTENSHNGNTVYRYLCNSCSCGTWWHKHAIDALREWNTRQAPPIGRCFECKHLGERTVHETGEKENFCNHDKYGLFALDSTNAYCSYFEPKKRSEQ